MTVRTKLPRKRTGVASAFVPFLMALIAFAVVAVMSYDFGSHNARYAVHVACARDGEANLRFSTIICAIAAPEEKSQ